MATEKQEAPRCEPILTRNCQRCREDRPIVEYRKSKARSDGLHNRCRACSTTYQREHRRTDPVHYAAKTKEYRQKSYALDPRKSWAKVAHNSARVRAKRDKVPFSLTYQDVLAVAPDVCPVLGLPLGYQRVEGNTVGSVHDASPTIDRVEPGIGYVVGNIAVISWRANALKRDATVAELEAVLAYMRNHQTLQ